MAESIVFLVTLIIITRTKLKAQVVKLEGEARATWDRLDNHVAELQALGAQLRTVREGHKKALDALEWRCGSG